MEKYIKKINNKKVDLLEDFKVLQKLYKNLVFLQLT